MKPPPSSRVAIQLGHNCDPIEQQAADELSRWVRSLFGTCASIQRSLPADGYVFCLGTASTNAEICPFPTEDEQQYAIRLRRHKRAQVCELAGGSPLAVKWAMHEAARQWGVTFLSQGDVLPARAGRFRFPRPVETRRPVFRNRAFRLINDMVNSGAVWSLADHERLFDQLVKLRFNTVFAVVHAHHPWVRWRFKNVENTPCDLLYGFGHPIHERSIGKERFAGLGDYTNPDLAGCRTSEERFERCRRLLHGIFAAAKARGLRGVLSHNLTDLPEPMKRRLADWSNGVRLPPAQPTPIHPHSLGLARDGGGARFGHLMSPLNPVYVRMVESWLEAHLKEYPEIDGLELHQQEFPASSAGVAECWNQLDRRHGLSRRFSLGEILAAGEKLNFHRPGRGALQTRAAIIMLRMLDLVINEHRVVDRALPAGANVKIYGRFMNHLLLPVVPHIFDPARVEFVATIDYTATDVAKRVGSLKFVRSSPVAVHLVTSIEDDNIGVLPQLNARPLRTIVRAMKRYGLDGYWLRHWLVSKHELSLAYLSEAGWDPQVEPMTVFRQQVRSVCGERAVPPMMRALSLLASTMPILSKLVGISFLMPGLLRRIWLKPDAFSVAPVRRLIREYDKVLSDLSSAARQSRGRQGQQYVGDLAAFVRFARLYLLAVLEIVAARKSYDLAERSKARQPFDIDGFDDEIRNSAKQLERAVQILEEALAEWAKAVRDPSDLGTLAGLNVYGLDFLRGKADEVRLRSEHWGYETAGAGGAGGGAEI